MNDTMSINNEENIINYFLYARKSLIEGNISLILPIYLVISHITPQETKFHNHFSIKRKMLRI